MSNDIGLSDLRGNNRRRSGRLCIQGCTCTARRSTNWLKTMESALSEIKKREKTQKVGWVKLKEQGKLYKGMTTNKAMWKKFREFYVWNGGTVCCFTIL